MQRPSPVERFSRGLERRLELASRNVAHERVADEPAVALTLGHDGEESAALGRALQPVDEAFAPAWMERLPVQLALGLGVRGAAALDHHRRQHLAGEELAQPEGHMTRWLRSDDVRGMRKPCRHRRRLVVDDVVDAWPPRSIAAKVARAASSMWMNDAMPPPSPTTGNARLRIASTLSPPSANDVPGP